LKTLDYRLTWVNFTSLVPHKHPGRSSGISRPEPRSPYLTLPKPAIEAKSPVLHGHN